MIPGIGWITIFAVPFFFGGQLPAGGVMLLMVQLPVLKIFPVKGPAPVAGLILEVLLPLVRLIT